MDEGIQEFYSGQSILLTGATGFLGKAIIEKLLRICPDIKMLYLVIRTKKGKDSYERINELFNDIVFGPMKKANPEYKSKVTVIPGDMILPDLGISESDKKLLMEEVTVVFHGAATVRFDEKLKTAVNINISGTKEVLQLSTQCRNLKAFVHISTAYSNCPEKVVKEIIYTPVIPADNIISIARSLPEDLIETCSPMLLGGWPNTYAFTKQIAEDLVKSNAIAKNVPAAIFRPSIIMGAYAEPLPGWIDNVYGPTGVTALAGVGVLKAMLTDISLKTELVPIDLTVNAALAVAWDVARSNINGARDIDIHSDQLPVYNFVTAEKNPFTWSDYMDYIVKYGFRYPSIKAIWYYSGLQTKYRFMFYVYNFFFHLLPALMIDIILVLMMREPLALKIYRKIFKFINVISYFSTREWSFYDDNLKKLWKKVPEKDRFLFNFDMETLNWDLYFKNIILGIRFFILHESEDTLPAARKRLFKLWIIHTLVKVGFISLIIWIFWNPLLTTYNYIFNENDIFIIQD